MPTSNAEAVWEGAGFAKAAESAKKDCPVSTALQGNVQRELDARLG